MYEIFALNTSVSVEIVHGLGGCDWIRGMGRNFLARCRQCIFGPCYRTKWAGKCRI